jgi:hypothetical protein
MSGLLLAKDSPAEQLYVAMQQKDDKIPAQRGPLLQKMHRCQRVAAATPQHELQQLPRHFPQYW